MAELNRDRAERIFLKLEIVPSYSTHFVSGLLRLDGKVVTALHYSNDNFDMADIVYHRLRRALRLSGPEFSELWGCTMSRLRYLGLLCDRMALTG